MGHTETSIEELKAAGFLGSNDEYNSMIGKAVKELLLVFQKQGHSGFSAQVTASIFYKLIKGEPLRALTENPNEWQSIGKNQWQNKRVSHVFKDERGAYSIEGKAFSDDFGKTWFTNAGSRVYFKLPGYPPKTKKIFLVWRSLKGLFLQ